MPPRSSASCAPPSARPHRLASPTPTGSRRSMPCSPPRPPRRQAPLSDEPTAGQQIQSLIALLRQNGVQRRMPSRLEEDDRAMLGGGAASAGQGPAAQPAAPPTQRATEADLFGAAPPDHFP